MDHPMPMIRRMLLSLLLTGFAVSVRAQSADDFGRFRAVKPFLDAQNFAGVVRAVEAEIARAPLQPEESAIYGILAVAALRSDQPAKAYDAAIHAVASDPSEDVPWAILHRVRPTPEAWEAMELPSALQEEQKLLPILRCDHSETWPSFAVRGCAFAYAGYAEQLVIRGKADAATQFRRAAVAAVIAHASVAYFERRNVAEADSLLNALAGVGDLSLLEPEARIRAYMLLAFVDRRKFRFLHAIDNYERVAALAGGVLVPELRTTLDPLLHNVFVSISWDPETLTLRERDPDDFFDNMNIDGPPLPTNNDGTRIPYGMTSADEDHPTMVAAIFAIELLAQLKKPHESLESIVQKRLASRNFELPVKLLVSHIRMFVDLDSIAPAAAKEVDADIGRIESALSTADDVPDATLLAFEIAKRSWKILNSVEKPRQNVDP